MTLLAVSSDTYWTIALVVGLAAAVSAFATYVFAAMRRGWRTSWRLWA